MQFNSEIYAPNIVYTTGDQTVSGTKTFKDNIQVSGTGFFQDLDILVNNMTISGISLKIIQENLILASPTGIPTTTGSNGISGTIVWDTSHLSICVATNTWRRLNLNTW